MVLSGADAAVVAEAFGCTEVLALLVQTEPSLRAARVIGDIPLVVRHGAALGRLRHVRAEALMAGALPGLGWGLGSSVDARRAGQQPCGRRGRQGRAMRATAIADSEPENGEADFLTEWFPPR